MEMRFLKLPAGGEAFNMCSDEGFRAEIRLFVFCSVRKIGALFNTQKADITVSPQLMIVEGDDGEDDIYGDDGDNDGDGVEINFAPIPSLDPKLRCQRGTAFLFPSG